MTVGERLATWLMKLSEFKVEKLKRHQLFLLVYPVLLFCSGIWRDPIFACVIALFYELGLVGLVLVYDSRLKESWLERFLFCGVGVSLIFICYAWVEICVLLHLP